MRTVNSNKILISIHVFVKKINQGLIDRSIFYHLIHSNMKLNLKKIVSMIFIDTKIGDWNIARQDSQYLIDKVQNQIINGYGIITKNK